MRSYFLPHHEVMLYVGYARLALYVVERTLSEKVTIIINQIQHGNRFSLPVHDLLSWSSP